MSLPTREITLRGIVLGALITVVFTASNIYLALKLGLTFASSIPATVISMAVLRLMGGATILENNMVQTQASAAGTLSCVCVSIPSLILIGHWQGFPYLQTALISAAGGMTGVLFTIPLRRALVAQSDLPYPEGIACAEILRAASDDEDTTSVRALSLGTLVAAAYTFLSTGLRLISDNITATFTLGSGAFRFEGGYSMALLGTGYLVGIGGGLSMALGVLIAWGVAVPWLSLGGNPDHLATGALAMSIWTHKVRFIGAGTIAIAAIWTLLSLIKPVARGLREAFASQADITRDHTDQDMSPRMTIPVAIGLIVVLTALFAAFLWPSVPHDGLLLAAALFGVIVTAILGFLIAAACGYMAGIIGSSSSPISGIGIVALVIITVLTLGLETLHLLPHAFNAADQNLAIAFSIFIVSGIIASAAISNDNLQDLKTGLLVGATPWKQEVGLLIGCVVGALVIPPVLQILYDAYGLVGSLPHPGMDPNRALAAPQPALIAAIATGILRHTLDWNMIGIGITLGVALIALDSLTKRRGIAIPPLAVGMGIYLPSNVSLTIAIGGLMAWLLSRRARPETHSENGIGTMLASGFIVGESLMGVVLAAIAGFTGSSETLAFLGPNRFDTALGGILFAAVILWFMRRVSRA